MIIATSTTGRPTERGFAYVMVLVAALVLGITAEGAVFLTSRTLLADREAELLFRGQAYRDAIGRYYRAGGRHEYPRSLDDLVLDPRFAHRRHIRKRYREPMTARGEWMLIRNQQGGITGVASPFDRAPAKQAGFPVGLEDFEGAASYREWVFLYDPKNRG